jgi:hypothetical protein
MTTLTKEQVIEAVTEAKQAAYTAAMDYIATQGENYFCGFAWVKVFEKGNTKMGRWLKEAGLKKSKSWGPGLDIWNPSGLPTQSMDVKEAGAVAAAKVLRDRLGVKAYAMSRAD